MTTVTKILERLAKNNLKTNPLKCKWAAKKTDFLGYIMTPTSVKPMPNKVEALLRLSTLKNKEQLQSFIGGINFYNNMWPRLTHVMAPLTEMTGNVPFKWTMECQWAFDKIKAVLASDCMN